MTSLTSVADKTGQEKLPVWPPVSRATWEDNVQEQESWLFTDLMPDDANLFMSGPAKRGYKSWLCEFWCQLLSTGGSYGPFQAANKEGVPVLYLAGEGGRVRTKRRGLWVREGLGLKELSPNYHFCHRPMQVIENIAFQNALFDYTKRHSIKFAIFDTWSQFSQADENSAQEVNASLRCLSRLRNEGTSCVVVHHVGKVDAKAGAEKDIDQDYRGSSALGGWYDQHWALRQRTEVPGQLDLTVRSKDDVEKEFEVEWLIDSLFQKAVLNIAARDKRKGHLITVKGRILATTWPHEAYTMARLKEIAEATLPATMDAVAELIKEGLITQEADDKFRRTRSL